MAQSPAVTGIAATGEGPPSGPFSCQSSASQVANKTAEALGCRRKVAGHFLDDRPQLANPQIRAVFGLLDARIRALDPNVSPEVLKLTIADKAETNVVDIVPQAKRLRLSLNMPFAELDDPRGIAKNVAGVGRWGNGEVEFGVASLEEVPYAIGLIRQSLDRQLDDTAEAP